MKHFTTLVTLYIFIVSQSFAHGMNFKIPQFKASTPRTKCHYLFVDTVQRKAIKRAHHKNLLLIFMRESQSLAGCEHTVEFIIKNASHKKYFGTYNYKLYYEPDLELISETNHIIPPTEDVYLITKKLLNWYSTTMIKRFEKWIKN